LLCGKEPGYEELLEKLVPLIIELMLNHPKTLWGDACYPVVGSL